MAINEVNGKCSFSESVSSETLWRIFKKIAQLIRTSTPPHVQMLWSVSLNGASYSSSNLPLGVMQFFRFLVKNWENMNIHYPNHIQNIVPPGRVVWATNGVARSNGPTRNEKNET